MVLRPTAESLLMAVLKSGKCEQIAAFGFQSFSDGGPKVLSARVFPEPEGPTINPIL